MCTGPNYKSCLLPTRWQGCCGILCYECGCSTKVALQGYSTTEICKALYPFTFMMYVKILNTGLSSIASSYNWQTWNFSTSTPIWKKRNYVVIFFINLVKLILLTFRPYRILGPYNFSAYMTLVGHVIYLYVNRYGFWTADWWQRSLGDKAYLHIWWRNTQVAQSSHRTGVVTWCERVSFLSPLQWSVFIVSAPHLLVPAEVDVSVCRTEPHLQYLSWSHHSRKFLYHRVYIVTYSS